MEEEKEEEAKKEPVHASDSEAGVCAPDSRRECPSKVSMGILLLECVPRISIIKELVVYVSVGTVLTGTLWVPTFRDFSVFSDPGPTAEERCGLKEGLIRTTDTPSLGFIDC